MKKKKLVIVITAILQGTKGSGTFAPLFQNADKRMEQLGKQKANGNLINLLKLLEK